MNRNDEFERILGLRRDSMADPHKNPVDVISLKSAALGATFGISIASYFFYDCRNLSIYIASLSLYHFLEFYITAKYNATRVDKDYDTDLLKAHGVAILELIVESAFFTFKRNKISFYFGLMLIIVGQFFRSQAMITANSSFHHYVQTKKASDHVLVTTGVYSLSRHPSYSGFFWWIIGLQVMSVNPFALIAFGMIIHRFFSQRIKEEEQYLISFFGDEYRKYKENTSTLIPFIS